MTPFDLTQCPPPEKFGPWRSMPSDTFITTGDVGRVRVRAVPGWGWKIDAEYCGTTHGCEAHTDADLPAAYRRAMVAVGLASPWTSEVPTQPGDYLVRWAETKGRPIVWTLDAGVWYGPSGVVSRPPPHGSSFLNIADLKERP